jgi:hypothetical protein
MRSSRRWCISKDDMENSLLLQVAYTGNAAMEVEVVPWGMMEVAQDSMEGDVVVVMEVVGVAMEADVKVDT